MENSEIVDILDDLTNLDFNESENDKLSNKFRNRTQVDINQPFYVGSGIAINLSQFLSIVLGFGLCLHMAEKFPSVSQLIFILCLIGLVLVEIGKRTSLGKVNEIRLINRTKKSKKKLTAKPYAIAYVFFIGASIYSGFVGGPAVIREFSEHKPLKLIEEIKKDFIQIMDKGKAEIVSQQIRTFAMAGQLHKESSWRGTTSRDVRKQKADLVLMAAAKDSVINNIVLGSTKDMNAAVLKATAINDKIVKEHDDWCDTFAWWAVICVVFLDIVLTVLCSWRYEHEYRKLTENKAKERIAKEQTEQQSSPNQASTGKDDSNRTETTQNELVRTSSTQSEQKQPTEKQAIAKHNPITLGNEQHGTIFKPQGAKVARVRYTKEDGTNTTYTKSDLVRMANRTTGTPEYKTELNRLIKLF